MTNDMPVSERFMVGHIGPKVATPAPAARPLWEIAAEIETDWTALGNGVNYAARPYLDAMKALDTMADSYYADSADDIVRYFLANAGTWRGEGARRLKNELKGMLK